MIKKIALLILISALLTVIALTLFFPRALEATIFGTIKGQVIAEDTGKGVENVEIQLFEAINGGIFGVTWSDKNGNFAFELLKENRYYLEFTPPDPYVQDESVIPLKVKPEFPGDKRQFISVWKGKIFYFRKILKVGGSISGTIYKKTKGTITPLDSAYVRLQPNDIESRGESLRTNQTGQYKFSRLDPNETYRILCFFPGYALKKGGIYKVVAGQELTKIDIIFDFDDLTGIEVTITSSADGSPVKEAYGSIFPREQNIIVGNYTTDENGKGSVFGLEPGIYTITANANFNGQTKQVTKELSIQKGITTKISIII